jgi:hypothetical protein
LILLFYLKIQNLRIYDYVLYEHTLVLLYFAEYSFLCRFRVESVNAFVLPRFDFCTTDIFFINKLFRTCANAFPNEFTVRLYEYWADQRWILSWMEENQTATYFLRSRLFTYDIMKNFNFNISLWFFKSIFRSYIGKHFFFIKIMAFKKNSTQECLWRLDIVLISY